MKTLRGGIRIKISQKEIPTKIEEARIPQKVTIPLHQHIGIPARPIVEVGQHVKKGQKIGTSAGFVSANVHASISGTVVQIVKYPCPAVGRMSEAIVIESDHEDEWFESIKSAEASKLSDQQLIEIVAEAGIVGMGGAGFPTHVKLQVLNKKIRAIILNGAECEPYVLSDHALMVENAEGILRGLELVMRITHAEKAYICIEENKPDAIEKMHSLSKGDNRIEMKQLKTRYPQGWENMLIKSVLNIELPPSKLPLEAGVIVCNVATAYAIHRAIDFGEPLIERIVSVTGPGVKQPKVLKVRIGTFFSDLIWQCGGFNGSPGKVIAGGPMMGTSVSDIDVPVVKTTNNILVLSTRDVKTYSSQSCIRCGKCVMVCPIGLIPRDIALLMKKGKVSEVEKYSPMDCKECGCCTYICPAKIPIVQLIRLAKHEITSGKSHRQDGN